MDDGSGTPNGRSVHFSDEDRMYLRQCIDDLLSWTRDNILQPLQQSFWAHAPDVGALMPSEVTVLVEQMNDLIRRIYLIGTPFEPTENDLSILRRALLHRQRVYAAQNKELQSKTPNQGILQKIQERLVPVERLITSDWFSAGRPSTLPELSDFLSPQEISSFQKASLRSPSVDAPIEIYESLQKFQRDHPDPGKVAFLMMNYGKTRIHDEIVKSIRDSLGSRGIEVLRADDKQYHDDLLWNVLTFAYGCGFGVAVYERLESDDFNPNVSLEVGYLLALRKPVCFLKDSTLKGLNTDLVGKLYKEFDAQNASVTIAKTLAEWVRDKQLVPED
jgi:hypothetical protein